MKLRIVERPWEPERIRFAVEQDFGSCTLTNDTTLWWPNWAVIRDFPSEAEAKKFLALYLKGPRVVEERDSASADSAEQILKHDQLDSNALHRGGDALQS